jgi:hypothetical protein
LASSQLLISAWNFSMLVMGVPLGSPGRRRGRRF